eukprot:PhM_4_TR16019/c0_g1_i1/m.443/K09527/DNAJC7; DnaJ homolog subfamily C member 7
MWDSASLLTVLRGVLDEMRCPICHDLLREPVEPSCHHAVCFLCAQKRMENVNMSSSPVNGGGAEATSCVVCMRSIRDFSEFTSSGPAMRGVIQRLRQANVVDFVVQSPPTKQPPQPSTPSSFNANLDESSASASLNQTRHHDPNNNSGPMMHGSAEVPLFSMGKSTPKRRTTAGAFGSGHKQQAQSRMSPPVIPPTFAETTSTTDAAQSATNAEFYRHALEQVSLDEHGMREQQRSDEQLAFRRLETSERSQRKRLQPAAPKPETSRRLKVEGDQFYERADYTGAIHTYTRALALNDGTSNPHVIHGNRSAAHYMLHNYTECIDDCLRACVEGDNNAKLLLRAAKSEANLGDFARAIEFYEKAAQSANNNRSASNNNNIANYDTDIARMRRGLSETERIKEIQRQGKFEEACSAWTAMNTEFPETIAFRTNGVECLLLAGQPERAVEDTLRLLSTYGTSSQKEGLTYLLGKAYYMSGFEEFRKAMDTLGSIEEVHPEAKKLLVKVCQVEEMKQNGNIHFQNRRWREAIALYTQAIEKDNTNRQTIRVLYCNRAAALKEIQQYRAAISDCTKALEIDKNFMKAYSRRARCYVALEEWDAACVDFNKAVELDRDHDAQLIQERTHAETMRLRATSSSASSSSSFRNRSSSNAHQQQQQQPHRPPAGLSSTTTTTHTHYTLLGISRAATDREIKKQYRDLSLKCHPDKCVSLPEAQKVEAEKMFKSISEAYSTLMDSSKRREYDMKLDREARKDLFSATTSAATAGSGFGSSSSFSYTSSSFRTRTTSSYW